MENLKIRVANEAESREAQELFFELGYSWWSGVKGVSHIKKRMFHVWARGFLTHCDDKTFDSLEVKEITLPELRDMVVLKRNDVGDATHIRGDGKIYFYSKSTDYFYQFSNDGEWLLSTWMNYQLLPQLKPIEKSKVEVVQDINKLKVEWFEKFLNGVKVQYRIGVALGSETSQWSNLTYKALKDLQHSPIEFREAPKYVVLNGITFKDKESLIKHIANNYNLD